MGFSRCSGSVLITAMTGRTTHSRAPQNYKSLLQKSPIKKTIFCKKRPIISRLVCVVCPVSPDIAVMNRLPKHLEEPMTYSTFVYKSPQKKEIVLPYGVPTISRLFQITGLFCRLYSLL